MSEKIDHVSVPQPDPNEHVADFVAVLVRHAHKLSPRSKALLSAIAQWAADDAVVYPPAPTAEVSTRSRRKPAPEKTAPLPGMDGAK